MDFFKSKEVSDNIRITLLTMQLEDGTIEKYPQGSFTFEYLLLLQSNSFQVTTQHTCTPNTFITGIDASLLPSLSLLSQSSAGLSSGFFFYESTAWLVRRNQRHQIPFYYNVQLINFFNNLRWSFIVLSDVEDLQSLSREFPAST